MDLERSYLASLERLAEPDEEERRYAESFNERYGWNDEDYSESCGEDVL